jgi:hypothetical protein
MMLKMKRKLYIVLKLAVIVVFFIQCQNETERVSTTPKLFTGDPFQKTIVPSQFFELNGSTDNVAEGENGTIIIMPKGCFKDSKGKIVTQKLKVELAEALSVEEMLLSNLTTTSNGKLLETGGMIYFSASANGEQLTINKDVPIHIEIPTEKKKSGMMAYKGARDKSGNMNWSEPQELKKFLTSIDIDLLNFYPKGFEAEVNNGLPFRNHKALSKQLVDSLYYSLSVSDGSDLLKGLKATDYNEPYYNENSQVVEGEYTDDSYEVKSKYDSIKAFQEANLDSLSKCGIDPAIIKVIKNNKFQNTIISTREFEVRLQHIFKTCDNNILEIYINNLDKNLWELDSMAAVKLGEHSETINFDRFYKQRLTNVKEADKYSRLLTGYYKQQLKKVKSELESISQKAIKELEEQNKVAEKTASEYKKLLFKRERYRMETYGFNWTSTGWANVDRGTIPKDWGPQRLEMLVESGGSFDRVHTYVVYTSIKSLYRLNSFDKELFYVGNDREREMLMPKKRLAVAVSIAYKDADSYLGLKEFETGSQPKVNLTLHKSSFQKIKDLISQYDDYGEENRIDKDLEYMILFDKEKKRQEKLKSESEFIGRLWSIANPCCPLPRQSPVPLVDES